ncbi:hypothetical protein B7R22_09835 [Subtercola boreus]|uniref:HTH cro/C1-type domain-containing protein n=1 Tax=Subtercola boreus TaxID=120213 RepID=A0A3E0VXQ7_9MICO|nr:helix-turn-helix transcriptional regulator [Subtercola boreus]RFA14511.1 hypothetical protein B7R22_09835 [Subtercola boreus]
MDENADEPKFSPVDRAFGRNVKRAREDSGLLQTDIASQMTARGHRYHQATVYKVESGQRKIPLGEAVDLADIVQRPLAELLAPTEQANDERAVHLAAQTFADKVSTLIDASDEVYGSQAALALIVERVTEKYGEALGNPDEFYAMYGPLIGWEGATRIWDTLRDLQKDRQWIALMENMGRDSLGK